VTGTQLVWMEGNYFVCLHNNNNNSGYFYSAYPQVSSKRFTFSFIGLSYLGRTRVTATNSGARSVITRSFQSGFILPLSLSIFDSFAQPTFSSSRSPPTVSHISLPLVTISLCNFAGGGNRSARRKPPMRGPSRNFLFRCDILHVSSLVRSAHQPFHSNIGHLSGVLTRQPRIPQQPLTPL